MKTIYTESSVHRKEKRIKLIFDYAQELIKKIRQIHDCKWSKTMKCWHIPYREDYVNFFNKQFNGEIKFIEKQGTKSKDDTKKSIINIYTNKKQSEQKIPERKQTNKTKIITEQEKEEIIPLVKYYKDSLQLKNYSPSTIEAYIPFFRQFVIYHNEKIDGLSISQMYEYVKITIERQRLSEMQIRHLISAIKFYYEKIKGWEKIYFYLSKKYEIKPIDVKLDFDELIPYIEKMEEAGEKLLILLKFYFGYNSEIICRKMKVEIEKFIQNKAEKDTAVKNLLIEIGKDYLKDTGLKNYLFENKEGKHLQVHELNKKIYLIVKKYKIVEIYKRELNQAMEQVNFEETTRKVYTGCFLGFIKYYNYRYPLEITDEEIRQYLVEIRNILEFSTSYQNQVINVLNFYYTQLKKRKLSTGTLIRSKREKRLPEILSINELVSMINKTDNPKHKLVIALLYSLGLRRAELLNLKINEFDFSRNVVTVRGGKGKKDRQISIPENLREMVIEYIRDFSPKKYLLKGNSKGKYSATSVIKVVKAAADRVFIQKRVYPHILRHSIATHMIEQGIDVTYVKEFLGHESIKTTMLYTHLNSDSMRKVKNPFDNLNFNKSDKKKNNKIKNSL